MVKTISTCRTINAILIHIKINLPKLVIHIDWLQWAEHHGSTLDLSENIAISFRKDVTLFDSPGILSLHSRTDVSC